MEVGGILERSGRILNRGGRNSKERWVESEREMGDVLEIGGRI